MSAPSPRAATETDPGHDRGQSMPTPWSAQTEATRVFETLAPTSTRTTSPWREHSTDTPRRSPLSGGTYAREIALSSTQQQDALTVRDLCDRQGVLRLRQTAQIPSRPSRLPVVDSRSCRLYSVPLDSCPSLCEARRAAEHTLQTCEAFSNRVEAATVAVWRRDGDRPE